MKDKTAFSLKSIIFYNRVEFIRQYLCNKINREHTNNE